MISLNNFFVSFAVKTLGPWCEDAKRFIDTNGNILASITREPKSEVNLI